jgi:hypothetical protein
VSKKKKKKRRKVFWKEQCPARGPGLRHRHDGECEDGHTPSQCCECGQINGKGEPKDQAHRAFEFSADEEAKIDFVKWLWSGAPEEFH